VVHISPTRTGELTVTTYRSHAGGRGAARCPEGIVCDTGITTSVPCSLLHDTSHLGFGGPEPYCLPRTLFPLRDQDAYSWNLEGNVLPVSSKFLLFLFLFCVMWLHLEELLRLYSSKIFLRSDRGWGWRDIYHARRRWKMRITCWLESVKGRDHSDLSEDVSIILNRIWCKDWIHLAQDRGQWWAFVNTLINIRGPYSAGNF
jgi:hypothetical protein